MTDYHQPVLLKEVIEYLAIRPDGVYVDATFGRGGHSSEILRLLGEKGRLLAVDKDPRAVEFARQKFMNDARFGIRQGSFSALRTYVCAEQLQGKVNGILLDLGISSPQLDDPQRGFSFLRDGPLDMRMDPEQGIDAATWINSVPETEIAKVLKEYGEERYARRIAAAIVRARALQPIVTTSQLAAVIARANPAWEKHKHPATRSFQAIRIFINQELSELQKFLDQCLDLLAMSGRLAFISFHSLEDRLIKRFVQLHERGGDLPPRLPVTSEYLQPRLKRVAWGVKPSESELALNPRARSAVLRVAEKIA
jgi:16S rRNA (cytosine1402-N4)-methyltransferase